MTQELLRKYIQGDATIAEKEEITLWLEADAEHNKEFMALRKLYDISLWQEDAFSTPKRTQIPYRRYAFEILKMAAVFVLAFTLIKVFIPTGPTEDAIMQSIYVPAGQRAELSLADGTKVWLNAKTTLTFPTHFTANTREVKLDGEGYFDVKRNPDKPFIVKTEKYNVRVLGTEFNVFAYNNTPYFGTALIKGAVEVYSKEQHEDILLEPNMSVSLINGKLKKMPIDDMNHFLWKDGIISFNNETVADMFRKLELYYDIKIIVNNKPLLSNRYSGKFRTKDGIIHVLRVLQLSNKFKYSKDENDNIITIS